LPGWLASSTSHTAREESVGHGLSAKEFISSAAHAKEMLVVEVHRRLRQINLSAAMEHCSTAPQIQTLKAAARVERPESRNRAAAVALSVNAIGPLDPA
jgi:hypothetical protein